MARKENCELTTLFLLRRGDEILLQNRVAEDWRGYTLPGGHVEPGESIVEAAVRELYEESGLKAQDPTLCGIKQFPSDGGRYLVFLFTAEKFSGDLRSSEEGEMVWAKRDEIKNLPTVDDFNGLLTVMESSDLSEFQYILRDGEWISKIK